jgi:hypothetical protein
MGTVPKRFKPKRFKSMKPKADFRVIVAEDAARLARSLRGQAAPFKCVLPGRSSSLDVRAGDAMIVGRH